MIQKIFYMAVLSIGLLHSMPTAALTAQEAQGMAIGESDARIEALNKALATADDKTAAFIQALSDDAVKTAGGKIFVVQGDKVMDPVTGQAVALPDGAEDVINNNRLRGELDTAQASLKLFSKDDKLRGEAIAVLLKDPDESKLGLVEKALAAEANPELKAKLGLARAAAMLGSSDKAKRLEAAKTLAYSKKAIQKLKRNSKHRWPRSNHRWAWAKAWAWYLQGSAWARFFYLLL
jgi:urea transport system permease protein